MTTSRAALLCATLSVWAWGCGAADPRDTVRWPGSAPQYWIPQGERGHTAQMAWGLPLSRPVSWHDVPRDRIQASCLRPGLGTDACYHTDTAVIDIAADLSPTRRATVELHELGHAIGHRGDHIPNDTPECRDFPGSATMCESAGRGPVLAPADLEWVVTGIRKYHSSRGNP